MTLLRLALLSAIFFLFNPTGASAQWCSYYDAYTYNCGFRTLGQCLANISGVGGICRPDARARWSVPRTDGRGRERQERRYR